MVRSFRRHFVAGAGAVVGETEIGTAGTETAGTVTDDTDDSATNKGRGGPRDGEGGVSNRRRQRRRGRRDARGRGQRGEAGAPRRTGGGNRMMERGRDITRPLFDWLARYALESILVGLFLLCFAVVLVLVLGVLR